MTLIHSVSNYVHCEQIQIAISNLDFTENFKVFLANSKVPGSSSGGVTGDFFFLSCLACKC